MTLEEIKSRMAEIRKILASDEESKKADLEALEAEINKLGEKKKELLAAEKRSSLINSVSSTGNVIKTFEEPKAKEKKSYSAKSEEYRSAFLKSMKSVPTDEWTAEERAAYTQTTSTGAAVLPTTMVNKIWSLIEENHSIMNDITIYRTGTILEVVKHTAISAGDAASTSEATAPTDENNTFVKVTLSGKDFAKVVKLSYASAKMSMQAFEAYITKEISDRLGAVMAADVITQIQTDMASANKTTGSTTGKTAYADLAAAFANLKRATNIKVYCNYATLYGQLTAMVDTTGRPIFQPNAQDGAMGSLIGGQIKLEDSLEDNVILIGDPTKVVYNMVQDIMIETDKDIETHSMIYSGYARGQGSLLDDKAFAQYTVKTV